MSELNNSWMDIESNQKHDFLGFEISDVLRISDKDYSVTFGLYFSVEWFEPRLNLSRDLWGEGRVASDTELIPGECTLQCQAEDEHTALEPGCKRYFGFTRSRCRRVAILFICLRCQKHFRYLVATFVYRHNLMPKCTKRDIHNFPCQVSTLLTALSSEFAFPPNNSQ